MDRFLQITKPVEDESKRTYFMQKDKKNKLTKRKSIQFFKIRQLATFPIVQFLNSSKIFVTYFDTCDWLICQ